MSKIEFKVWEKNITSRKDLPSFPSETLVRIIKGSFLKKKIKRFIQIGSSIEYGKIRSPQKEQTPKVPFSILSNALYRCL